MTIPAQRIGADLYRCGAPISACGNAEEIRGWLQAANEEFITGQQATEADHQRLVDLVQAAVEEAKIG